MHCIISRCLLGDPCRYDGRSKPSDIVCNLVKKLDVVAVCPEVEGGLTTPRIPSEYDGHFVSNAQGRGVHSAYLKGASYTLAQAQDNNVDLCIMKEKSPSCGSEWRYDGTFSSQLVSGEGITSQTLYDQGFVVVSEVVVENLFKKIEKGISITFILDAYKDKLDQTSIAHLKKHVRDLNWNNVDLALVDTLACTSSDKPHIIIELEHGKENAVYACDVFCARQSHASKESYLLCCLVASALNLTIKQDTHVRPAANPLATAKVGFVLDESQSLDDYLCSCLSSLHGILHIE